MADGRRVSSGQALAQTHEGYLAFTQVLFTGFAFRPSFDTGPRYRSILPRLTPWVSDGLGAERPSVSVCLEATRQGGCETWPAEGTLNQDAVPRRCRHESRRMAVAL